MTVPSFIPSVDEVNCYYFYVKTIETGGLMSLQKSLKQPKRTYSDQTRSHERILCSVENSADGQSSIH